MTDIKWIKLDTGIFDNRKIKQIRTLPDGDSLIIIWLQLMCLAGTINDNGRIYFTEEIPYTDQMLSTAFGEPLPTVQLALQTFKAFRMIDVIDDVILISNWEKYQSIEGMEKIRQQTRQRVANYREKQKQLSNVTVTLPVTQCNATDIDIDKNKNKKKNIFIKPSQEEVKAFFLEKSDTEDNANKFYDYYESNGWKVGGRTAMKDWKASARNWMRNEKEWRKSTSKVPDFTNPWNQETEPHVNIKLEDLPF